MTMEKAGWDNGGLGEAEKLGNGYISSVIIIGRNVQGKKVIILYTNFGIDATPR